MLPSRHARVSALTHTISPRGCERLMGSAVSTISDRGLIDHDLAPRSHMHRGNQSPATWAFGFGRATWTQDHEGSEGWQDACCGTTKSMHSARPVSPRPVSPRLSLTACWRYLLFGHEARRTVHCLPCVSLVSPFCLPLSPFCLGVSAATICQPVVSRGTLNGRLGASGGGLGFE